MTTAELLLLHRVIVPSRLALIYRDGETLGYNPALNTWHRVDETCGEVLRWLRAGRDKSLIKDHLVRRFGYTLPTAVERLQEVVKWCVLRRLLYLDRELELPALVSPTNPLATVYWICSQACNLRCTYCYQEAMVARPNELSTSEGKALVDQAVEAGASTFIFTGGEPFTRHDLLEVAKYSKECGLRTNVITNGHYIEKENVKVVAEIFDVVTISLDHGLPEHHDRHRGSGSWRRALNGVDLLLEAGAHVDINSVLSQLGLRDVKELFRLIRTRRIGQHKIVPRFPMGRGASSRNDELTPTELLQLSDHIHNANRDLENGHSHVKPEGSYGKKGIRRNHCGAGFSEVSIDPEGWVYPCKLLQYPQFRTQNIRDARLKDIFHNDPLLGSIQSRVVDTLHPCKTCIIKNHCGGGCRGIHVSFTQEYIQAHPLFCSYLRRSFEVQAWENTGSVPAPRKAQFLDAVKIPHT
jgi:radical SAM protein with 4Fe4S-binding SPASM domain